jgi:exodeoxyribonuclease I
MSNTTFLWHDYETFGANARRDRPAQFAAIRTDFALNEIGEPMMIYCRPANDFLPDPKSCLITGITPQTCLEQGIPEHQFAAQIEQALSQPGTVGVGYNTIRFDDEITRFMFWRNLIDPYAREWQNNCGRWDILDMVRAAYVLRPDGIAWPKNAEGKPSFKLTDLTAANGLMHESAHDALSDVRATIALARLIREKQPRLFDFCFKLHKKDAVQQELGLPTAAQSAKPFLHISGMFPAERGCLAVMWPLAMHPTNKNELIAWDLAHDPRELATLNADEIRLRLFSKADALPEGMSRLPVKTVHLNKSPMVMRNFKVLSKEMAERWSIDVDQAMAHADMARDLPDMSAIWPTVFQRPTTAGVPDVDEDLYNGLIGNTDRRRLNQLRSLPAEQLANARNAFDDARLEELVFRYRARNFPATLSLEDATRWEAHRVAKLFDGEGSTRTIETLLSEMDELFETAKGQSQEILDALYDYTEMIAPDRAAIKVLR